jgi:hypothetical protein
MKMNVRATATVILKVLGIYIFLQFLTVLPMALTLIRVNTNMLLGQPDYEMSRMSIFTPMGLYIAFMSVFYLGSAWVFIFRAKSLSRFFAEDLPEECNLASAGSDPVLTLAFQCLGLYAIVTWAPQFVQTLVRTLNYGAWSDPQTPFSMRFYQNGSVLISPIVGTVIGLLLLFKGRGLLRLIKLSRTMAPEKVEIQK